MLASWGCCRDSVRSGGAGCALTLALPLRIFLERRGVSRPPSPGCPRDPAEDAALGMLGRLRAGRVAAPPPGWPAPRELAAQHLAAPGRGRRRRGAALRIPEQRPNFPPTPLNFPPGGEVPGLRGVRRRRPGRRAEFLEGAARGSPQHGLLRHVVPRGHGEPRSSAGEPPTCGCLSPSTNLRGDDGLGLGSREIRRHGDDEGDLCSCREGRGRRGGDPVSSPGLAAPRRCGPGFDSCPERGLLAGAAASASPGRREARSRGFCSEHLGSKSNSGRGAPGGPSCVWRLWVSCSPPCRTCPRTRAASAAPLTGEVTWLGKLTFS